MNKNLVKYILLFMFIFSSTFFLKGESEFIHAKPIWAVNREEEKNLTLGFVAKFHVTTQERFFIKVTGSSFYRLFVNGEFTGYGPARAAHDYYRVDYWEITEKLKESDNVVAVEVAGYNVNGYYSLDQPAFLQAEVISNGEVLIATGIGKDEFDTFQVLQLNNRVQKVPRYSFQRPFMEAYRLDKGFDDWLYGDFTSSELLETAIMPSKKTLNRNVCYPEFIKVNPIAIVANGTVATDIKRNEYWKDRSLVNIGEKLKGYKECELSCNPSIEVQDLKVVELNNENNNFYSDRPIKLESNNFITYRFPKNMSGFIGAELNISKSGKIYFIFDEMLTDGDLKFNRTNTINIISFDLQPGKYKVESFEPYTLQYLKVLMVGGDGEIKETYLREYTNTEVKATFSSSDVLLNEIYNAGIESFRQNSVDLFTDCPSRERAGWLCDSYFMGRAAMAISGNTVVEKNFMENYMLPKKFEYIPNGMLPMCYPADHYDGQFIPNWAMWFVIELYEYYQRSNDREMIDNLKPKVLGLISYFDKYKNEYGLLEKLPGWKFVEWSDANKYVNDVNYPTNMLYAAMLDVCSYLYDMNNMKNEADKIRDTVIKQSFNGIYFVDNAIRDEKGVLVLTENISEACQYYAFYFNVASPETFPDLWDKIIKSFGPTKSNPNVVKAEMLMGIPLRLLLLSRYKLTSQFLNETKAYMGYMAESCRTLWEHTTTIGSLNHGFLSFINDEINKNILGIYKIDKDDKIVMIKIPEIEINSCKGTVPFGEELITCEWERSDKGISINYSLPEGYRAIVVEN